MDNGGKGSKHGGETEGRGGEVGVGIRGARTTKKKGETLIAGLDGQRKQVSAMRVVGDGVDDQDRRMNACAEGMRREAAGLVMSGNMNGLISLGRVDTILTRPRYHFVWSGVRTGCTRVCFIMDSHMCARITMG
jgi:hypothetical protein